MQIIIEYESSWRNSFLDGSNNEPLPKQGRKFIASMTELKKEGNFKPHSLTKNTVMGVLNRLIGDQRKLYQSRLDENYYFKQIELNLSENDIQDQIKSSEQELIFLRNISGSTDQNSFTGMIKSTDLAFNSPFSEELWGILFLSIEELIQFILDENKMFKLKNIELDPIVVINQLEDLNNLKPIELARDYEKAYQMINKLFPDVDFKLTSKGLFIPISFYTAALYMKLKQLNNKYDLTNIVTKSGGLSGISKRGFTKKDFMDRYTTGAKKLIWGNPYMLKTRIKGEGERTELLTKNTGKLIINLNISNEEALDLEEKIQNAGVSAFYLGKKGLAYVSEIII